MTEAVAVPHHQLSRVLGIVFGLAVVVGGVIGSGIMRAPGVVALGIRSEPTTSVAAAIAAIARAESGPARILICGSLYLAGTILAENG